MKDLAALIGFLLSDGSIYFDKSKRTYCIQFTNKVFGLREKFKTTFESCFGKQNFRENKCRNAISIRVFSSKIAKKLLTLSPSYRTKQYDDGTHPNCKVPDFVFSKSEFIAAFIKAYSSSDGCVYANKYHPRGVIEIACYHPLLRIQISECLNRLNIQNRITKKRIVISRKDSVAAFLDKCGFFDESVVCNSNSQNYGIRKNELLHSFLVQTLELPAKLST